MACHTFFENSEGRILSVDIIILTYKPDELFHKLMEMLERQTKEIHHIILMNTEEAYFDYEIKHPNIEVHHIKKEEFDHGATRALGMSYAKSDFVICMTQDAVPENEFLIEELLKPFEDQEVAVSYARQLPNIDSDPIETFSRSFNYPEQERKKKKQDMETMGIKAFFCSDVCAAYRKSIYDSLGGFDSPMIFNEDMVFAYRCLEAGYAVFYAAKAKVIHSHHFNFMQQLRRNFDLGVSQTDYSHIFSKISSEKEGKSMIKKNIEYLCSEKKFIYIFVLIYISAAKYIGYRLGKRYQDLSYRTILKYTSNKEYWKKEGR